MTQWYPTERQTVEKAANSGLTKLTMLSSDFQRYCMRCVLAGMYLTITVLVYWSLINNISDPTAGKLIGSLFFGVGLTVIYFTNSELFTSNCMYMAVSMKEKNTSWGQTLWLWTVCYLGNFVGAIVVTLLLYGTGLFDDLPANHQLYLGAVKKTHLSAQAIFFKGIFANWVVCLAIWVALQLKEEVAKIAAIILVVFIFVYLGFEHSIANMGLFSMSLAGQGTMALTEGLFNLLFSTLGNIVGGSVLVGLSYCFLSSPKGEEVSNKAVEKTL